MKESAQLGAAEWANLILECFWSLMEVAESWESVRGKALCILAVLLLLLKHPRRDCWQLNTGTGLPARTHCGHSYSVMTSEKPVGTGNNEFS